ncbi:PRD domain-containing protein [Amedibacterium intestinale]|uniref:PRD domain-containing protein n=1 Tax=Amedibacterium intestinale TaxID=2583452 RepID=UPI000E20B918
MGFGKREDDVIDQSKIEKRFVLEDKTSIKAFQELLGRIDIEDIELASDIIQDGENYLGYICNNSILLTLSDHISFMLKRVKENTLFTTPLEWDIKLIYPNEFRYAQIAVENIKKLTGLPVPEQEAAFIALHFINSHYEGKTMEETVLSSKIIQNVIDIAKYHYGKEFNQESFNFSRFVTHIRYFVMRQLHNETGGKDSSIINVIALKYPNDYKCAKKIKEFLEMKYQWRIRDEELLYLSLHLNRLAAE